MRKANLAITNRCNLNCSMCDIWKEMPKIDLSLDAVSKIVKSLPDNSDLTITGGEPFMHPQFDAIVEKVLPYLRTVSTNGVITEKIVEFVRNYYSRLADFSLHISIDGIHMHDVQRGKSLQNILKTIRLLRQEFPSLRIKIKFTITSQNIQDIIPTYEFCMQNNLEFKPKIAEYAPNYTNRVDRRDFNFSKSQKEEIVYALARIPGKFVQDTIDFLNCKHERKCAAPSSRLFVIPNGDVYSCIHFPKIGNIYEQSLDEIWKSELAEDIRNKIKEGCNRCIAYHGS